MRYLYQQIIIRALLLSSSLLAIDNAALQDPHTLREVIIAQPAQLLRHLMAEQKAAAQAFNESSIRTQSPAVLVQTMRKIIMGHERRCPYFLLHECAYNGETHCPLNREINPHYRAAFEEQVVADLCNVPSGENTPLQYCAVGSGGLFQELVILTKFLKQRRTAVTVHVIDPLYQPLVIWADHCTGTREIDTESFIDPLVSLPALSDHAKKTHSAINNLIVACISHGHCVQQLVKSLRAMFPETELRVFAHPTLSSYSDYIEDYDFPPADVVAAADLEDEDSVKSHAQITLKRFCLATLINKAQARNSLLTTDKNRAAIIRLQPEPSTKVAGTQLVRFEYGGTQHIFHQITDQL